MLPTDCYSPALIEPSRLLIRIDPRPVLSAFHATRPTTLSAFRRYPAGRMKRTKFYTLFWAGRILNIWTLPNTGPERSN